MGALVVAAPIVWSHYLIYFLVPLAIAFPRLDRRWLCPGGAVAARARRVDHACISPTSTARSSRPPPSVGSNSYGVLLGYLLVTAVVVLLTVRARDGGARARAVARVSVGDAALRPRLNAEDAHDQVGPPLRLLPPAQLDATALEVMVLRLAAHAGTLAADVAQLANGGQMRWCCCHTPSLGGNLPAEAALTASTPKLCRSFMSAGGALVRDACPSAIPLA